MNSQEPASSSTPSASTQGRSGGDESDKSYFSPPPAVSLPKGGGAIKGMGEKFATNPVTGTGSMSVPIATSPGRSGFGPQLSLSYDSGAGNGIFGLGWNLSLPSITRKTDKGLPRYFDAEESDVFVLSGAEDLVPIYRQDTDGTWVKEHPSYQRDPDGFWVRDANGHLVIHEDKLDSYLVRRYRPRIEGLFARIERWTQVDSGETHWRSITKDNITTLYGKTAESRIADPDDPTRVFSWLICESYDDKGNVIRYGYKAEDSAGIVTAQAHERNRTPKSQAVNRYLKRIQYGNLTPRQPNEDLSQRQDWLFEAVFDYGEYDPTAPKAGDLGVWLVRNDPFSSYRAGFEVRTYRLCQRVLMFHHFQDEADVGQECLVRSTDFTYSHEQNPADARNPIYSLLLSVTQTGYKPQPESGYVQKSLPPLEFIYSEARIDETVREVDPASLENLPQGLDGTRYQWVDLDGEGLSGILTEQGNGWFYKRNLSPLNKVQNNGDDHFEPRFAPVELVASKPASGLADGAQFLDLAGDGQLEVVTLRGAVPGFYERNPDQGWDLFKAFKSLPVVDWDNPNLKFIDLNGDGHSDILITEDNCFVWHPSLAEDGFGVAERVSQSWDEEKGPRIIFADSTQSIHLADMSGDGLTDIVRIRNGEVCYWANLGYGRFGVKVAMDNAPWFDAPDLFDQRRVLLADIDGSGTTDILYLSGEGVQIYFNQSGNSWAAKRVLKSFPAINNAVSVTTLDLLGNGTACLVWSSPLPGHTSHVMRYIDLMGGQKPHLLVKTTNNMGAATLMQYAPSTKFYLQDKFAGQPWITKLPFPVHVVERVETRDHISGNRFVSRYAYHHGYFDGEEREFRGFGFVEQWDTEDYSAFEQGGGTNLLEESLHMPPVLTKTWFHTGAYLERTRISDQFKQEYYQADSQALLLPDTLLPEGLTIQEEREAARSLKGHILRQEIYALDGSDQEKHPYTVSERNYEIRLIQELQTNRHAVFYVHDRETIDYHYERNPVDPRITHAMTLEVDEFGNGLKAVAIAYPRRTPAYSEQEKPLITYTENQVTNKPNEATWYRIGIPIKTRTYEITGVVPQDENYFILSEFYRRLPDDSLAGHSTAPEIPYEAIATGETPQKRIIERVRSLYRPDDQANTTDPISLPLGEVESLALPCESFKLAFTPGLLAQVYSSRINSSELNALLQTEGRYVQQDGGWWIASGRQAFDPAQFFLSTQTKDPFGNVYASTYDAYHLLVRQTIDPLGNTVQVRNDYRMLQPEEIIDPNGNRAQVAFDALGMVVGTAVMGKASENQGDNLTGFVRDLDQTAIENHVEDPLANPQEILANATTRLVYDLERYRLTRQILPDGTETGQPVVVYTMARETHTADFAAGEQTKIQHSLLYSDGFGREIQTKVQAEPGLAPGRDASGTLKRDASGKLILEETNSRWVGTGRTIFNNKGKPVKQYEPFFSATHRYETEPDLVEWGVTPIIHYDPLERVIRTELPNGTVSRVEFDSWQQATWDENDTVLESQWYQERQANATDTSEARSATLAAKHANTPTIAHLDKLGRTFLTIADNAGTEKYPTHIDLDSEGNQLVVTDARDNPVMVQAIAQLDAQRKLVKDAQGKPIVTGRANDLLGHQLYSYSMDAGERWVLNNVAGHPIRSWNSRGFQSRHVYDALQRPTHLFVQPETEAEFLAEVLVYGEAHPEAIALNLRGKNYQHFDGAGVVTSLEFDFKGNLLRGQRQLAKEYRQAIDWAVLAGVTEVGAIATAAAPLLESEIFGSSTTYDGLNRPVRLRTPDNSEIQPSYNEANLLEQVQVRLRQSETWTLFVKDIDYDAKGQRTLIEYGNGVRTEYFYDEKTFRLIRLRTARVEASSSALQDLAYTYDPVGNITEIRDGAQETIFFNNAVVSASAYYEYDALYRLTQAFGREHIGQTTTLPEGNSAQPEYDAQDYPHVRLPHPNEGQAMRRYAQRYDYDAVGNILQMLHEAAGTTQWSRNYDYATDSNRLLRTSLPQDAWATYTYDIHGSMTKMPHLMQMDWDFKDQLQRVDLGGGGTAYYVYDAGGQRVRKVQEHNGATVEERIYLGGFEVYRKRNNSGLLLERETLHIMDDKRRIALVETKTFERMDGIGNSAAAAPVIRYQLDNHLGSASLELDAEGTIISYEEYYPYGNTSYQAGRSIAETSLKRYRYTGKERDEETGLYYHGARYYAPWLGRWTSCDPAGMVDGTNLYRYTRNNPVLFTDPNGNQSFYDQNGAGGAPPHYPEEVESPPSPPESIGDSGGAEGASGATPADIEQAANPSPLPRPPAGGGGARGSEGVSLSEKAKIQTKRVDPSRGSRNVLAGAGAIALGGAVIASGPLGWATGATAAMGLAGGIPVFTLGMFQSFGPELTAEQHQEVNATANMVSMASNPAQLVGGSLTLTLGGDFQAGATVAGIGQLLYSAQSTAKIVGSSAVRGRNMSVTLASDVDAAGEDSLTLVRVLEKGRNAKGESVEKWTEIQDEMRYLQWYNQREYYLFSHTDSTVGLYSGGEFHTTFELTEYMRRLLAHTHPKVTGPSHSDLETLRIISERGQSYEQKSSWLLEPGLPLQRFRRR